MSKLKYLECEIELPLLKLPVRSIYLETSQGKWLFSPGSKLNETELKSLGDVTDIIAPNLFHCAGIPLANRVFPQAKVWGPPGAMKLKPEISWTNELSTKDWPYKEELTLLPLRGMPKLNEHVFIHKASRTLIVTDLVFNLTQAKGFGAWVVLNMFGTYRRFGVSRLFMQSVKNKDDFADSMSELFQYDFNCIVMSHGDIVEKNGKSLLQQALLKRGISVK